MRGILLSCLLTGLFCSDGEGVRLLPFPDVARSENTSVASPVLTLASFQPGVIRQASSDGIKQLKFESGYPHHSTGGNNAAGLLLPAEIISFTPHGVFERTTPYTSGSSTVMRGRAPPFRILIDRQIPNQA